MRWILVLVLSTLLLAYPLPAAAGANISSSLVLKIEGNRIEHAEVDLIFQNLETPKIGVIPLPFEVSLEEENNSIIGIVKAVETSIVLLYLPKDSHEVHFYFRMGNERNVKYDLFGLTNYSFLVEGGLEIQQQPRGTQLIVPKRAITRARQLDQLSHFDDSVLLIEELDKVFLQMPAGFSIVEKDKELKLTNSQKIEIPLDESSQKIYSIMFRSSPSHGEEIINFVDLRLLPAILPFVFTLLGPDLLTVTIQRIFFIATIVFLVIYDFIRWYLSYLSKSFSGAINDTIIIVFYLLFFWIIYYLRTSDNKD